jgi:hypothetical protein
MALVGTVNAVNSSINSLSTSLGFDGWQLSSGTYNGCSFAVFTTPALDELPVYNSGVDVVANINQYLGGDQTGTDSNRTGQLYNTFLGMINFSDKLITGTVQKQTPYANSINIEDMGFKGYEFKMSLLFVGSDYQKALSNFENAIKNPPTTPDKYLKLEHPTRGLIDGYTYVIGDPEIVHSLSLWRGAIMNITFRAVETPKISKSPYISLTSNVLRSINTALGAVSAIAGTIAIIKAQITGYLNLVQKPSRVSSSLGYRSLTSTQATTISTALNQSANKLLNCVCYLYKRGDAGVTVVELDNKDINYSYIPPSLNQSRVYNENQNSLIMDYYYADVKESIAVIESAEILGASNDIITELNTSVSKLAAVCDSIASQVEYQTYITHSVMSIRKVMSINNIPLSSMAKMMKINPQIICGNYIVPGTAVNLL